MGGEISLEEYIHNIVYGTASILCILDVFVYIFAILVLLLSSYIVYIFLI